MKNSIEELDFGSVDLNDPEMMAFRSLYLSIQNESSISTQFTVQMECFNTLTSPQDIERKYPELMSYIFPTRGNLEELLHFDDHGDLGEQADDTIGPSASKASLATLKENLLTATKLGQLGQEKSSFGHTKPASMVLLKPTGKDISFAIKGFSFSLIFEFLLFSPLFYLFS